MNPRFNTRKKSSTPKTTEHVFGEGNMTLGQRATEPYRKGHVRKLSSRAACHRLACSRHFLKSTTVRDLFKFLTTIKTSAWASWAEGRQRVRSLDNCQDAMRIVPILQVPDAQMAVASRVHVTSSRTRCSLFAGRWLLETLSLGLPELLRGKI